MRVSFVQAFIGYRDNGTDTQYPSSCVPHFQIKNFVSYDRSEELVSYLDGLYAGAGFGGCADVAGALQVTGDTRVHVMQ